MIPFKINDDKNPARLISFDHSTNRGKKSLFFWYYIVTRYRHIIWNNGPLLDNYCLMSLLPDGTQSEEEHGETLN